MRYIYTPAKLLCLLLLANIGYAQETIPPYNDLHTEGYNGNIKTVTTTSYTNPVYSDDGATLISYDLKDVIRLEFNKHKMFTLFTIHLEVEGKNILYDSLVYTYTDVKNFSYDSYDQDGKRTSSSVAVWETDKKKVVEKYNNNLEIIEKEHYSLNKNYKIQELEKEYLTTTGSLVKRRVTHSKYNNLGNLIQMTYNSYGPDNKRIKNNRSVMNITVLERDKNNNPTRNTSIISG